MTTATLDRLLSTPTGRKLVREAAEAELAQSEEGRLRITSEISTLTKREATERSRIEKAVAQAVEAENEAVAALEVARSELRAARLRANLLDSETTGRIEKLRNELAATTFPQVAAFRAELHEEFELTRLLRPQSEADGQRGDGGWRIIASNAASLERRLAYLTDAQRAGIVRISHLATLAETAEAIAELRAGIPVVRMEKL